MAIILLCSLLQFAQVSAAVEMNRPVEFTSSHNKLSVWPQRHKNEKWTYCLSSGRCARHTKRSRAQTARRRVPRRRRDEETKSCRRNRSERLPVETKFWQSRFDPRDFRVAIQPDGRSNMVNRGVGLLAQTPKFCLNLCSCL